MAEPSAVNYIKEQLHAGYSKDEIRKALIEAGWTEKDIDDAFYVIEGETPEIKPQKQPQPQKAKTENEGVHVKEAATERYISQQSPTSQMPQRQQPHNEEKKKTTTNPMFGTIFSIIGGIILFANLAMNFLGIGDMLILVYGELDFLSFITKDMIQIIVIVSGAVSIISGIVVKIKSDLDLYMGLAVAFLGLAALLTGNGYIIGGVFCIIGGSLLIARK